MVFRKEVSSRTLLELAGELDSLRKRLDTVVERCVVLNGELWSLAKDQAERLGHRSVSEYIFDLIREDKKKAK